MNSLTGKKCSRNLIEPVLPDCSASIPLCLGLSTLPSLCSKQCQARPHRAHQIQCCGQALFKDLEVDFTKIGPNRRNKYLLILPLLLGAGLGLTLHIQQGCGGKSSNQSSTKRHHPPNNAIDYVIGQWPSLCGRSDAAGC